MCGYRLGLPNLMSHYFPNDQSGGIINSHVREGYSKQTNIIHYNNKEFLVMISHLFYTVALSVTFLTTVSMN